MLRFLSAVCLCFLPLSLWAQDSVQTRAGLAREVGTYPDNAAYIGDTRLSLPEGVRYISFPYQIGDLLLISYSFGGNGCPAQFVWAHSVPGAVRLSERFGTCSDSFDVTYNSETVSVSMPSMRTGENHSVTFVYDGRGIREVSGERKQVGVATVAGWEGRHVSEPIGDADWEAYFLSFMSAADLADARRILQVGIKMSWDRGWLTASGCQPHNCTDTFGAIAMNGDGSAVIVALWEAETGVRLWGNPKGIPLPTTVGEVLAKAK